MEKAPRDISHLADRYDRKYSEKEGVFAEKKTDELLDEVAGLLPQGSRAVELGAGQGRSALKLAELGLRVRAIDISSVGVDSMNKVAEEKSLDDFKAEVGDAREGIEGEYELVVSMYMLHHFTREEADEFIENIKNHTVSGGINFISAFTNEGDAARIDEGRGLFYPEEGELKGIYSGWEIIGYTEEDSMLSAKKKDGTNMRNTKATLIARKTLGNE